MPKAPPKFVTNLPAWEYTLAKLETQGKLNNNGDPTNYGAAIAIYKNVVAKYPGFAPQVINRSPHTYAAMTPSQLDEIFPVGQMFWFEDCLVTAVPAHGGLACFPDSKGSMLMRGCVEDVDPEGPHKEWVGKISVFPAAKCLALSEA